MISVCIATYNSSKYILEQIDSILPQLGKDDEIIISDDGSKDDTIQKIKSIGDDRIHIHSNEGVHGYTPNFENALKHAVGDYIFLSDHDDKWMSNKVEVCMRWLRDYDYVVSDAIVTNEKFDTLYPSYFEHRVVYSSWWGNLFRFGYLGCLHAFKREILKKGIPFPTNYKYSTHDNWLFMIGISFFRVKVINQPLIYYRRHSDTASDGGNNEHKPLTFRIAYRLYILRHLAARLFY